MRRSPATAGRWSSPPDSPERTPTWACVKGQGKLDEAVACYRRAVELKPDFAEAHNNLGNAFKDQGELDEAAACYRRRCN